MPVKIDTGSMLFEYRVRPCRSLPDWCIENGKFYWPIEKVFSVTCMYKQPYLYARAKSDKRVFTVWSSTYARPVSCQRSAYPARKS